MGFFRPTRAEIHIGALRSNFESIKKNLPPDVGIMGMVKADAYGHGAVQISRTLANCGAVSLGVATVEEGLELRESGIHLPVLVLGGLMGVGHAAAGMMVGANLTPVVHSTEVLDFLEATAAAAGKIVSIHLKIDTGMTRLGVMPQSVPAFMSKLGQCSHLRLAGVMTHFSDADSSDWTNLQLELFNGCVGQIEKIAGAIDIWHVANSTALFNGKLTTAAKRGTHWCRPGIALYGASRHMNSHPECELKPVMTLKSKIAMIKSVPAGTQVSYGRTFETKRSSRIGVLPIGYADGYPWALSNSSFVIVGGKRVSVVGSVTMDMVMIDLTDAVETRVGDEVVLLGGQGSDSLFASELGSWARTISYEILCGISKRIPRVYVE